MSYVFSLGLIGVISCPAVAQVTPDETLGGERSQVNRNVQVRGGLADRIEGGATRGSNLFHSFSEFNVNEGQRVYFANPAGIANILSRVTGSDVSDIMGTLGVDGSANLFLLNPNGIIFGPNARLDVSGSFTASTASSLTFPDGSQFSATNPGDGSLLSVNVPLGVQYGPTPPGAIANAGSLSVGQNLSLSGGSVTSTGRLAAPLGQLWVEGAAGDVQVQQAIAQTATLAASNNLILSESQLQTSGDLNLFAGNTVQVRDSIANPFIAYAGGNLTVQGNQNIDLFALNHPFSGLVAGRDMVLRSANQVSGDAHYQTGGNFRVERLDGNPGNLFSPYDPVIISNGNVEFDSYVGASLHIYAAGSVRIHGNVEINRADGATGIVGVVDVPDPTNTTPLAERQITIDGQQEDGQQEATLDIRSGVFVAASSPPPFPLPDGVTDNNPPVFADSSGTDIRIGSITNNTLRFPDGTSIFGRVYLQSAGSVELTDSDGIFAGEDLGNYSIVAFGNPVTISAQGNVLIPQGIITGADIDNVGDRGDIRIFSGGIIDTTANGATIPGRLTSFVNQGARVDEFASGRIFLRAINDITIGNISSRVLDGGTGIAGSIDIQSTAGQVRTGDIEAVTPNTGSVTFTNGSITISAQNGITTGDLSSRVANIGLGGAITLTNATELISTGTIESSTANTGTPDLRNSDITITANNGNIETNAIRSFVGTYDNSTGTSIGGVGSAGQVRLDAPNGSININGEIASFTGDGFAGDITISGSAINTDRIASSASGNESLPGRGGNISLQAVSDIVVNGDVNSFANGRGGFIRFVSTEGSIDTRAGTLRSSTFGGQGGNVRLEARGNITTGGIESLVDANGAGNAGNISLRSFTGEIDTRGQDNTRRAEINSESSDGLAGNVIIRAPLDIHLGNVVATSNNDVVSTTNADGESSSNFNAIRVNSTQGSIFVNGVNLTTTNTGRAFAGDVILRANQNVEITGNRQTARVESQGNFGRIIIAAGDRLVLNNSELNVDNRIEAQRTSFGGATSQTFPSIISINAGLIDIENSFLTARIAARRGTGGLIRLDTPTILLRLQNENRRNEDAVLSATASGGASGGNIDIVMNRDNSFVLANPYENSDLVASASGTGNGGNINITTSAIFGLEERNPPVRPLSDINASSEFGNPGSIVLNTLGVNPTRGLGELTIEIVDASSLVADGCIGSNRSGVETQGEFTRTGRGGLSPDPSGSLTDESLVDPASSGNRVDRSSTTASATSDSSSRLVEAQGLSRDPSGKVSLVPGSTNTTVTSPAFIPLTCDAP